LLASSVQRDKPSYRTVVCPLNILRKEASRQLAKPPVIPDALTADTLLVTTRIGAVAPGQILLLLALHLRL